MNTNIFQQTVGALNLAPTKISGQYKVVIDMFNKIWLDDYTGRRKALDLSTNFLQQVSDFLSVDTTLVSTDILRYGATQSNNIKKFHIPIYFNQNYLPRYFVVNKVQNTNFDTIFNDSDVLRIVDLYEFDLQNIIDTINDEIYFDSPTRFNWEDNQIVIYGQGITEGYPITKTIDLTYLASNQNYLDIVNNTILETFESNKIFFPRFLNLEIEFEYIDNQIPFNNFIGFLSDTNIVSIDDFKDNSVFVKFDGTNYLQQKNKDQIVLSKYLQQYSDYSVIQFNENPPQFRFQTTYFSVNNIIEIFNFDSDNVFTYIVKQTDIGNTLSETAYNICKNASNGEFEFTYDYVDANKINIKIVTIYDYEGYTVKLSTNLKSLDDSNKFYSFGQNDVVVLSSTDIENVTIVSIPNEKENNIFDKSIQYSVIDKYIFDGYKVFRLENNVNISGTKTIFGLIEISEYLQELKPIDFYSYYSTVKSELQYNFDNYKQNLYDKYYLTGGETFLNAWNNYVQIFDSLYKYVGVENNELIDTTQLELEYHNETQVKNILFSSIGFCSYITPNILNIDSQCWENNGCPNIETTNTNLKYSWFLLKGEIPQYLIGTINENRYLDSNNKPKITSKIIKTIEDKCETLFLGVKYFLPLNYEGYDFAVYLDFNDDSVYNIQYGIELFDTEKLILVKLNKYLDFSDLIRGGDINNQPLVDLSLFYNALSSMNTSTNISDIFLTTGINITPYYNKTNNLPLYNNIPQKDWITDNMFCIRRGENYNESFINLFPISGDYTIDIYSDINYQGSEYSYKVLSITFVNINNLYVDYFWCSDIKIKFLNDNYLYLYDSNDIVQKIDKSTISETLPFRTDTLWGYIHEIIKTNDNLEAISLTDSTISLKENYFEIKQTIEHDPLVYKKEVFKFQENNFGYTDTEFIDRFFPGQVINNIPDLKFDTSVNEQIITLFDRSQIWNIIASSLKTEAKFKYVTKEQLQIFFDEFSLLNFKTYCEKNNLHINDGTTINLTIPDIDNNVVIYNMVDNIPKVYLINRHRFNYTPYFEIVDMFNFQLQIFKQDNNSQTLDEITNIVSKLFCKENDIFLSTQSTKQINYLTLLENTINLNELNSDEYIISDITEYCKLLLLKYYYVFSVTNENNQKINYTLDNKTNYTLLIPNYQNYQNIKITLKRK